MPNTELSRSEYLRLWHAQNPGKSAEYNRTYYKKDPEKSKKKTAAWNKKNPVASKKIRDTHLVKHPDCFLLYNYNLLWEDYYLLLDAQHYSCGICFRHAAEINKSLGVDHDHSIDPKDHQSIRGLLCDPCNLNLGHAEKTGDFSVHQYFYLHAYQGGL